MKKEVSIPLIAATCAIFGLVILVAILSFQSLSTHPFGDDAVVGELSDIWRDDWFMSYEPASDLGNFHETSYVFDIPEGWVGGYLESPYGSDLMSIHNWYPDQGETEEGGNVSIELFVEQNMTLNEVLRDYTAEGVYLEAVEESVINSPTAFGEPVELPLRTYTEDNGNRITKYYFIDTTSQLGEEYGQILIYRASFDYVIPSQRDAITDIDAIVASTRFIQ